MCHTATEAEGGTNCKVSQKDVLSSPAITIDFRCVQLSQPASAKDTNLASGLLHLLFIFVSDSHDLSRP